MAARADRRSDCPLNVAVETFGDRWSLLIIRDLMLKGAHSFQDLMEGGEGIATNILTNRLDQLAAQGIITKARLPSDRRKFVYRLTSKGIDLAPVLHEMILWGAFYEETAAPPEVVRAMRTDRERYLAEIRQSWERQAEQLP